MFKLKTHEEDLSLVNAFQNAKFQAAGRNPATNTEADKESVRDKEPTYTSKNTGPSFYLQITYFGQCISTKNDPFV